MSYLIQYRDRGFSGNPFDAGMDRTISCDVMPLEYPCEGNGDYRHTAFGARDMRGVSGCDLRYVSHTIKQGKYSLPGMPAVFASDAEAQTLRVELQDERLPVEVTLLYGVLPERDCITRSVIIRNAGQEDVVLENAASAALDFLTGNFDLIKGVPVYCSDTTLAVLNNNAGKYQENQHSYASPVLSVNGGYGIIYNTDATGYTVFDRDNQIYSSSSTKMIYAADVAANGIYALLTRSDDYLSKLTAYRTDNLEKYEYAFADYYVNTVSLNNNGTRAVLSGMSARIGEMISVIYTLDFRQSPYLQKYEFDDV